MSADSPRRSSGGMSSRGFAVPATVPPQVVSDRSILDSAIGFINDVTLSHQPHTDPKDTITWARFEYAADISDPRFGDDWELEGNVAPPLLLILGYGLGVQVWAIPANGEAVEVLSWRHGVVSALRVLPTPAYNASMDMHGRADESHDAYAEKRPLIALVDGSASAGVQPQFCAVNFISLKTGTQVKTIKFKNPVLDILANRDTIVITFHERIAIFDASTLDDRLSITTCYPSPGINPNPVALGPRWLAYAEHKYLHAKRSSGGCDGDGVPSYTATVLNAAKSFGKGLRELGEQVAAGLTGTGSGTVSKNNSFDSCSGGDLKQPGIMTILDIKHPIKDYSPTSGTPMSAQPGSDPIIAHFIAHTEAVVACEFDNSGMLLVTADRRGHNFHVFRIQPHPVGPSLAAVHHLYVLHRGDTSAKVQNISFSLDSRWVAVSTLRGTTHVFPITPYGGAMGVRTHTSLHVVNKLSRFHRSAGLSADGRSSSPISHSESTTFVQSLQPYHNPTLPPFPRPTVVLPLAQLRQPLALGSPPGSAGLSGKNTGSGGGGSSSQRQRLSSLSDDSGKPLSVCAIFAKSRAWLLEPPNATREAPHRMQRKAVDSLFVMAGHGALIQYDLDVKLASNVAKEKICDDTPIELDVEAKAQWNLGRRKDGSQEVTPPLGNDNWLMKNRSACQLSDSQSQFDECDDRAESWLSQVEIITHAGPHRRLWMGPQFVFKTYNTPSGSNLSHVDAEAVEIGVSKASSAAAAAAAAAASTSGTATIAMHRVERSSPLNMPLSAAARSTVPVLIESGSYSSIEQSPKLMDRFRHDHLDSDFTHGDTRLKEDLADAMRESPSVSAAAQHLTGRLSAIDLHSDNIAFYDALAEHENDDDSLTMVSTPTHTSSAGSVAALANVLPNIYSYDPHSSYESLESLRKAKTSIEKIVNPLGTVTTVTAGLTTEVQTDILDEVVSQLAAQDSVIHENCDESLFRPVVAIFCDEKERQRGEEEARKQKEMAQPPETVGSKLIVPVIEKAIDDQLNLKEKQKHKQNQMSGPIKTKSVQEQRNEEQKIAKTKADAEMVLVKKQVVEPQTKVQESKNRSSVTPDKETKQKSTMKQAQPLTSSGNSETKAKPRKEEDEKREEFDEGGIEFKRMTPLPAEKPNNSSKQTASNPFKISSKSTITTTATTNTAAVEKSTKSEKVEEIELVNDETVEVVQKSTKYPNLIKTEILNAAQLTDSLMELNEDHAEEQKEPSIRTAKEKPALNIEIAEAPVKPPTAASRKANKKNKKQNRSSSNSESEEIVEVKTTSAKLGNQKEAKQRNEIGDAKATNYEEVEVPKEDESKESVETVEAKPEPKPPVDEIKIITPPESPMNIQQEDLKKSAKKNQTNKKMKKQNSDEEPPVVETLQNIDTPEETVSNKRTVDISLDKAKTSDRGEKCKEEQNKSDIKDDEGEKERKSGPPKPEKLQELDNARSKQKTEQSCAVENETQNISSNQQENTEEIPKTDEKLSAVAKNKREEREPSTNDLKVDKAKEDKKETSDTKTKGKVLEDKSSLEPGTTKSEKAKKEEQAVKAMKKNETTQEKEYKIKVVELEEKELSTVPPATTPLPPKTEDRQKLTAAKTGSFATKEANQSQANKSKLSDPTTKLPLTPAKPGSPKQRQEAKKEKAEPSEDMIDSAETKKPIISAWSTLSGAEMINKSLGSPNSPTKTTPPQTDFKTPAPVLTTPTFGKKQAKKPKTLGESLEDFPSLLQPLESLPPLPTLEPLEDLSETSVTTSVSLINFESPLQEQQPQARRELPAMEPAPRGFEKENLIFALCGSLHYEHEMSASATMHTMTASLDNSSTSTSLKMEKISSSSNSSASEDIIVLDEKKLSKKQKRKKQQQLDMQQKRLSVGSSAGSVNVEQDMDEELRPLIGGGMTNSMMDTSLEHFAQERNANEADTFPKDKVSTTLLIDDDDYLLPPPRVAPTSGRSGGNSTTTDSEGPMPATTSDDNICSVTSYTTTGSTTSVPHKIKTKKLEHKINLIAAIEAATSSSTSSAEESGFEGSCVGSGGGRASDSDIQKYASLTGKSSSITSIPITLPLTQSVNILPSTITMSANSASGGQHHNQQQHSGMKKKTKRRKR